MRQHAGLSGRSCPLLPVIPTVPPFTYTQTPSGALGVALGGRMVGSQHHRLLEVGVHP